MVLPVLKHNMEYKELQKIRNWRDVEENEVILDCDNKKGFGDLALRQVGLMFSYDEYRLEIYKAEGQKSYHIHIKDIPHIAELPKEQNKLYKELLIKKYVDKAVKLLGRRPDYFGDIDYSLCSKHSVAEENKKHFKYNSIKKLIAIINEGYENFCDKTIYNKVIENKKEYNPNIKGSGITAEITQIISIIDIAKQFGLEVDKKGFTICPFHMDSDPSLKFYESQGRFICFGCNEKGNILYFYAFLKKLNPKFKYKK